VREAASVIAHPAIRNFGTLGGSLAHADPAPDYPAAVVAAGAHIEVAGPGGRREIPAGEFFLDYLTSALEEGELVTALLLPPASPASVGHYVKFSRVDGDYAIASVAVALEVDGIYENIGGPPTHTAANTDLARMADGAGCINCHTPKELTDFAGQFRTMMTDSEMGYLVAKIEPFERHPWKWEQRKPTDGVEDKYNFLRYIEKLEGVVIHPGAAQN
jgi:hypothetical protein